MFNVVKVARLITTLIFLGVLLLAYAYLPLTLDINIEGFDRVGRDFFFYLAIGLYILFNLITYFLRFYADRIGMSTYRRLHIHALAPVLYFSMTVLIGYITVVNKFQDPSIYNYLNYVSIILIAAWFFSFLFVSVRRL